MKEMQPGSLCIMGVRNGYKVEFEVKKRKKTMSTTTTAEPKKKIGKTTLVDVAIFDELKQLGFRAEKLDSGWSAYEISGDRKIGPATSIKALATQVKLEIGNKIELPDNDNQTEAASSNATAADTEEVELQADSNGNAFLPGTAPKVNKQLSAAILKYHEIKMERVAWTAKETAAMDELEFVAKLYENLYVPDPKKPKTKIYKAGNIIDRIVVTKETKHKTEEVKDGGVGADDR